MSVAEIKQVLHSNIHGFLQEWLPGGKVESGEYKALNPTRSDDRIGSFSVNLRSGVWADFADDARGGDLISLFAYLFCNGDNREAVRQLGQRLGIGAVGSGSKPVAVSDQSARASMSSKSSKSSKFDGWVLSCVREGSPAAPVAHFKRGRHVAQWAYHRADGALVGFVRRFERADGGKEVLPLTIWESPDGSKQAWRWAQMPPLRLLFRLPFVLGAQKVLVVEGEKSAEAALPFLAGKGVEVTTWSGGSKAVAKTDWRPLAGKQVVLWPDADAPGEKAMEEVGRCLLELGCEVWWVNLPSGLPAGWDCADWAAVNAGADLLDWMRPLLVEFEPDHGSKADSELVVQSGSDASWEAALLRNDKGRLLANRDNVFLILSSHPDWRGALGFDEFAGRTVAVGSNPAGICGEVEDIDDLRIGHWLATEFGLPINNATHIAHGVQMAADLNRFHPVRDYLDRLRWDGVSRLAGWLSRYAGAAECEYVSLVGRFFLIGMVARIFKPGCPMQYMPIFEGEQGRGKSTLLRILGGQWFADTGLSIGEKDAYIAIQGVWLYEVAELDSFNKKDATAIKSFVTSQFDKFREPYGRRDVMRPRQVVFAGTTNQHEYFKDTTGNRRFWPVTVGEIDLEALAEDRDQLFAEAVALFKAGKRWYPTRDEEARLFVPQQRDRELSDPRLEAIVQWLETPNNFHRKRFTSMEILEGAWDIPPGRADRSVTTAFGMAMRKLGWKTERDGHRQTTYYIRPEPKY